MSDIDTKSIEVDEAPDTEQCSSDPAYENWAKRKIKRALEHDVANPDKRMTQEQMWKKHGLAR